MKRPINPSSKMLFEKTDKKIHFDVKKREKNKTEQKQSLQAVYPLDGRIAPFNHNDYHPKIVYESTSTIFSRVGTSHDIHSSGFGRRKFTALGTDKKSSQANLQIFRCNLDKNGKCDCLLHRESKYRGNSNSQSKRKLFLEFLCRNDKITEKKLRREKNIIGNNNKNNDTALFNRKLLMSLKKMNKFSKSMKPKRGLSEKKNKRKNKAQAGKETSLIVKEKSRYSRCTIYKNTKTPLHTKMT
ncbi:unnamed protein product [Moneuplotes crassus]|uniref:Uncharacterized protein n=1 Tax=Euplotes crassus TaxID=5936 RepID=A0AAD1XJH5_EUPCR|nr:unnamed protein product [Moneuplotes crassus]